VLFAAAVAALIGQGHRRFLELGSSRAVRGHQRMPSSRLCRGTVLASLRRDEGERETPLRALGALYVQGQPWLGGACTLEAAGLFLCQLTLAARARWLDAGAIRRETRRPSSVASDHPMLGVPVRLATPRRQWVWETDLGPESHSFLGITASRAPSWCPPPPGWKWRWRLDAGDGELPGGLADVPFPQALVLGEDAAAAWSVHGEVWLSGG